MTSNLTLEEAIGHRFSNLMLLRQALVHRSYTAEHPEEPHNERLEFLGDTVLELVVTERLFNDYPEMAEGEMAKVRAALVNEATLAETAAGIGLGEHLVLGKGEEMTGGREKDSLLSDTFEALLGAIYLDSDYQVARSVILRLLADDIALRAELPGGRDYKTRLQETLAQLGARPLYQVTAEGPDHDRTFEAVVMVRGGEAGRGTGPSKKAAEQIAARHALADLEDSQASRLD